MQLLLFINNHRHQRNDAHYTYVNSTHKTISEIIGYINNNYYEDIDKELLIEEAINGMVSSVGDEYTNYSDSDNASEFYK